MTDHDPTPEEGTSGLVHEPVADVLAKMTGRPASDVDHEGRYEFPDLDELETSNQRDL